MPTRPEDFTIDMLLEYLARGHGFAKHGEGLDTQRHMDGVRSFRDTTNAASTEVRSGAAARSLGPDLHINTPEDLKDYMRRMLSDPATEGFVERNGTIQLFNQTDKTRLIINPLDNSGDFGTIHRYPSSFEGFRDAKFRAQRDMGRSLVQFDNSVTRDAALNRVQGVVDNIRANPHAWRPTLANDPGTVTARLRNPDGTLVYPGTQSLSRTGVSADYAAHAAAIDRINGLRAGLDYGRGYVAQADAARRPSRMFFWDQRTNVVTEINGRELIQHTFGNLPQAEQARLAEQFFELNREGAAVVEGGYDALVRAYQSAHSVQGPAVASTKSQLISALRDGRVTGATNVPYESVDDAARILVGFSREQAQAFDLVPAGLSAEALSHVDDPKVAAAILGLSQAKGYAQTDDTVTALSMFAEQFDKMDEATRAGVARTLEQMARSPLPDAARATTAAAHAADALDGMGDLARLARTAKAGRLGLNFSKAGVVTAVVTTGLAVSATAYANATVMDIADRLHESKQLSDEAYADYRAMMNDVGTMLTAQAADPTVLAIPGTFIVESIAHNRFQEFSDRHQLPQHIHEMLSPSIYAGSSVRGEIGDNTFRTIPDDPSQAAPELRALIEAKQGVMQARQEYSRVYAANMPSPWVMGLSAGTGGGGLGMHMAITNMPDVQAAQAGVDQAQARFQAEFDRLLSNPQGARALASLLTNDQLLEIVEATAKYNNGAHQDPLIQEFVRAQALDAPWYSLTGAWSNMQARDAAREALLRNPEVMRDYLAGVFVPPQAAAPTQAASMETGPVQSVTLVEAPLVESSGNRDHLSGFSVRLPPIPQAFTPGRLDHYPLPPGGTSVNITETYQYTFMANAFARLQSGQEIEPQERAEISRYMNDPGRTYMDDQIIAAVRETFPDIAPRFTNESGRLALPRADNLTGTFRNWTHPLISIPYIQPLKVTVPTIEPLETPLNQSLKLQISPQREIEEPLQLRQLETQKL